MIKLLLDIKVNIQIINIKSSTQNNFIKFWDISLDFQIYTELYRAIFLSKSNSKHIFYISVQQKSHLMKIFKYKTTYSRMSQQQNPERQQLKQKAKNNPFIGHFDRAPLHNQTNEHIYHGYRINFDTPSHIIKSLFMVHNETLNIWTHLIPSSILITAIIYLVFIIINYGFIQHFLHSTHICKNQLSNYIDRLQNVKYNISNADSIHDSQLFLHNKLIQQFDAYSDNLTKDCNILTQLIKEQQQIVDDREIQRICNSISILQDVINQFELYILNSAQYQQYNLSLFDHTINKTGQVKTILDDHTEELSQKHDISIQRQVVSKWPLVFWAFGALFSLFSSTIFHLFTAMSQKAHKVFHRLDYSGITINLIGGGIPAYYYTFYCDFSWAIFYIGLSVFGSLIIFGFMMTDWFYKQQHIHFKTMTYVLYGLHYAFPTLHMIIVQQFFDNFGDHQYSFSASVKYIIYMAICCLIGATIYILKWPQKQFPGKFDIVGHSHQIWHLFAVGGVYFTYRMAQLQYQMRSNATCPLT